MSSSLKRRRLDDASPPARCTPVPDHWLQAAERLRDRVPKRRLWDPEPSTVAFLARFAAEPGLYVFRDHAAYGHPDAGVFKAGRAEVLGRRLRSYRSAQTVVGFQRTPFLRAAEWYQLQSLRSAVVHGHETVQAPLDVVLDAAHLAVQCVHAVASAAGFDPTDAYDRGRDLDVASLFKVAYADATGTQIKVKSVEQNHQQLRRSELKRTAKRTLERVGDASSDEWREAVALVRQVQREEREEHNVEHKQPFVSFVEECCVTDVNAQEYCAVLYQSYQGWCARNGNRWHSKKWFGMQMTMLFGSAKSMRIKQGPAAKAYRGVLCERLFAGGDKVEAWTGCDSVTELSKFVFLGGGAFPLSVSPALICCFFSYLLQKIRRDCLSETGRTDVNRSTPQISAAREEKKARKNTRAP